MATQFDQVVLAGGGNRCWWQAGFWHVLNEKIPQAPKKLIAISAGAATACLFYARPGKDGAAWEPNQRLLKGPTNLFKVINWTSRNDK